MPSTSFDVLIVGGGVIGSAIAYFLSSQGEAGRLKIGVVERDPTYARSSTALSVGGIRHQFSTPENIQLSMFSSNFIRSAGETLALRGERPDLAFREQGYLFLATSNGREILERNRARQTGFGAEVAFLDQKQLGLRFPWLTVSDLAAGSLGLRGEGWLDPHSLLQAFKGKARDQGVVFLHDEVEGISLKRGRVVSVTLASSGHLDVGAVVNAAGPRAAQIARLAGIMDFPVFPRKRYVYRIQIGEPLPGCPMVIDPTGVYFRPEGDGFLCGVSPQPDQDPDTFDLDMDYDLFQEQVWPTLAHRAPVFDSLRLGSSWAGHYAYNPLDQNAILGPHPDLENLIFANGFSGHGLQHAPGIGRGISELILFGGYRTLDLTGFGVSRFTSDNLIREENVV